MFHTWRKTPKEPAQHNVFEKKHGMQSEQEVQEIEENRGSIHVSFNIHFDTTHTHTHRPSIQTQAQSTTT